MPSKRGAIIIAMLVAVGVAVFLAWLYPSIEAKLAHDIVAQAEPTEAVPEPFASLDLKAKAVVVWDVANGRPLFAKNERAILPLASLTKVMTALVSLDNNPSGATVTIRPEDLDGEGDQGLRPGEVWPVVDLIGFTLITSSNDGALSLAAAVALPTSGQTTFVQAMNAKADALGLGEMYFLNPTGLDTTSYLSGGYGSAHDMARLFSFALTHSPSIMETTADDHATFFSQDGTAHRVENTNEIVERIPWLLASKTGFTDLAGGNLAIAFDAGLARPVVVVVLGSTQEGRFSDIEQLVKATFTFLEEA